MPKFRGKCGCKPTPLTSDAGLRTRLAVPEGRAKAQANREEEVWSWRRFFKNCKRLGSKEPKNPQVSQDREDSGDGRGVRPRNCDISFFCDALIDYRVQFSLVCYLILQIDIIVFHSWSIKIISLCVSSVFFCAHYIYLFVSYFDLLIYFLMCYIYLPHLTILVSDAGFKNQTELIARGREGLIFRKCIIYFINER